MGQEHPDDIEVGSQVRSPVAQILYGKNKIAKYTLPRHSTVGAAVVGLTNIVFVQLGSSSEASYGGVAASVPELVT